MRTATTGVSWPPWRVYMNAPFGPSRFVPRIARELPFWHVRPLMGLSPFGKTLLTTHPTPPSCHLRSKPFPTSQTISQGMKQKQTNRNRNGNVLHSWRGMRMRSNVWHGIRPEVCSPLVEGTSPFGYGSVSCRGPWAVPMMQMGKMRTLSVWPCYRDMREMSRRLSLHPVTACGAMEMKFCSRPPMTIPSRYGPKTVVTGTVLLHWILPSIQTQFGPSHWPRVVFDWYRDRQTTVWLYGNVIHRQKWHNSFPMKQGQYSNASGNYRMLMTGPCIPSIVHRHGWVTVASHRQELTMPFTFMRKYWGNPPTNPSSPSMQRHNWIRTLIVFNGIPGMEPFWHPLATTGPSDFGITRFHK
mmetsp:Transcript_13881/g.25122  ORF Transcript_13881/g.25122 Transcript_13881/m.25122 type:complete len:356 (+) Transcript_13881:392-1459(+)